MTSWKASAESQHSSVQTTKSTDNFPPILYFSKVLIANRGAIATRIINTLRRLGIDSVAIYAEADAHSLHVELADEAFSLGNGSAATTYLDQQKIIAIALKSGAKAIHPGYGFLSENPAFAESCESAGLAFIGPTPGQMRMFGLKHSARQIARQNGVPLVPGSDLLTSSEQATRVAEQIGYPVMLKSTAGGGGIGMQLVQNKDQLSAAFASVKRLSSNNFANDGVFLEKFIENARHIEVQVIGNGEGQVAALGERDCSSQRRHQKVIEESPAPNLAETIRQTMLATAKRLMSAVHYRNAGTVEFIFDADEQAFYFLEVNTRLQVEHGVTELVWDADLVESMLAVAAGKGQHALAELAKKQPTGHAIQVRLYAEDPNKNFQPCAGLLTQVQWPDKTLLQDDNSTLRIDRWIEAGLEVSPLFDPMLAKVIVWSANRYQAINNTENILKNIFIYGIETNLAYAEAILASEVFRLGLMTTSTLKQFKFTPATVDVVSAGLQTTIQDYPGRRGYWHVGVPPSGPFDAKAFRLGNKLLENDDEASGLEFMLEGPTLQFNTPATVVLTGAGFHAELDGKSVVAEVVTQVQAGQSLRIGKLAGAGARGYLLINGGFACPAYLGSQSTFTLGQFGGHAGRALRTGDVLHIKNTDNKHRNDIKNIPTQIPAGQASTEAKNQPGIAGAGRTSPESVNYTTLRVVYGPHGAPDFFTANDIATFFAAEWEVHYHSSRTGIRLLGPKPEWARSDGGEAGMHPSNIHDNAYAIGSIDFTGDMPVILGPDGPSLGGFVCPATVIQADLWKLGQLKAGDKIRFVPVKVETAVALLRQYEADIASPDLKADKLPYHRLPNDPAEPPVKLILPAGENEVHTVYRVAGDGNVLVEYGEQVLDLRLRFRVHALMQWLQDRPRRGLLELTPGIRSLQVHFDPLQLPLDDLLRMLKQAERALLDSDDIRVPSRIIHLPLSWNDSACQQAIDKYMQTVRKDAPWCPSNIEFIRRINGLESIDDVKRCVFSASYVVMGLGDVYLGAPVATPLDPRHRLVTTKYNPARTWTAENSVGIGGAYLCIYGMEGPGGYQFVGRTLQMWNRYHQTREFSQPWLLRFFDQIRFYEVSEADLKSIRQAFPKGKYPLRAEATEFSLRDYESFLLANAAEIDAFSLQRSQAFNDELKRWVASGQINFEAEPSLVAAEREFVAEHEDVIESPAAGSLWKVLVDQGSKVSSGQLVAILESMKMEIEVRALASGTVRRLLRNQGQQVQAGQPILVLDKHRQ